MRKQASEDLKQYFDAWISLTERVPVNEDLSWWCSFIIFVSNVPEKTRLRETDSTDIEDELRSTTTHSRNGNQSHKKPIWSSRTDSQGHKYRETENPRCQSNPKLGHLFPIRMETNRPPASLSNFPRNLEIQPRLTILRHGVTSNEEGQRALSKQGTKDIHKINVEEREREKRRELKVMPRSRARPRESRGSCSSHY